jgi:carboxymethylenebutenolidase
VTELSSAGVNHATNQTRRRFEWIEASGGAHGAWISVPRVTPSGSVVLAHHRTGVDDFMWDAARRCLDQGFAVTVPDFFRLLPADLAPEERKARLDDEHVIDDLRFACTALRRRVAAAAAPSILGFCMGGRVAFLGAAATDLFSRAACFYGGDLHRAWGNGRAPIDVVRPGMPPVQLHRGSHDRNPSAELAAEALAAVERSGGTMTTVTYAGARHAFLDWRKQERYVADAASLAWRTTMAFLSWDRSTAEAPS